MRSDSSRPERQTSGVTGARRAGSLDEVTQRAYGRVARVVARWHYLAGEDAADIVQEAFARYLADRAAAEELEAAVASVDEVAAAVLSQARTVVRSTQRKQARRRRLFYMIGRRGLEGGAGPSIFDEAYMAAVLRAMDRLPCSLRRPLVERSKGHTMQEIAERLRIPQGTVKSRLHRARAALRRVLDEETTPAT